MPRTVTLTLTDDQFTAVSWEAAKYHVSVEVRLLALLRPSLHDTSRRYIDTLWEERRRTLEANHVLAAQVDAAMKKA